MNEYLIKVASFHLRSSVIPCWALVAGFPELHHSRLGPGGTAPWAPASPSTALCMSLGRRKAPGKMSPEELPVGFCPHLRQTGLEWLWFPGVTLHAWTGRILGLLSF